MKKTISVLILAIVGIFTLSIKTFGATNYFEWNSLPLYANYLAVEAEMDLTDERAYGFEVYIPYSDFHVFENGNVYSYITFYDDVLQEYETFEFRDFSNPTIADWYTFDFASLGLGSLNINRVVIVIVQSYTGSVPSGYINYLNTASLSHTILNYDYQVDIQWNNERFYGDYYYVYTIIDVIEGARNISIFIPYSDFHAISSDVGGQLVSEIRVATNTGIFTLIGEITDYTFGSVSGLIKIDFLDEGYELNDIQQVKIIVPQNYYTIPSDYIAYLNRDSYVSYNDNLYIYELYVDGVIYDEGLYKETLTLPSNPTKTGYIFNGWMTIDGQQFTGGLVNDNLVFNNTFQLFASFREGNPIDITTPDPTENNILANVFASFNLNTSVGYIIVYLAVIMISLFALNKFNMPQILTIITLLLITAFWMFLGFLPVLMSIMAFAVLIYMFITNVRGGANE